MKQLIYFHERNVCAGKKLMLHFTMLPGNWPLWWSEILCKVLSYYSNAPNAAPCSNRLYTFQRTFIQNVIELNAITLLYICVECSKL